MLAERCCEVGCARQARRVLELLQCLLLDRMCIGQVLRELFVDRSHSCPVPTRRRLERRTSEAPAPVGECVDRREFLAATAALPFAIRSGCALGGSGPLALVTADLESRIVVLDARTGRVLRHIHTAPGPRSIETVGARRAVVAHTGRGSVSVVDARRVHAEVGGFGEPRYTAAHPNGWIAYVTDSARGELVVLHVIRGAVLARLTVGVLARHVSLSPDGRTLWIALGSKAEHVAVVDVSRATEPRLVARFAPPFRA